MTVKAASIWTAGFIAIVWLLIPALASWHWGLSAKIRLDPQISEDYDSIFVEGETAKKFMVPWLSFHTPIEYLRLRYTPTNDDQPYGIMFIDPKSMAYEAASGYLATPSHLKGRLDSPQAILDWIRSQPGSAHTTSHTNDAQEIYNVIQTVASKDLEHFKLPTNFPLRNLDIGHQSQPKKNRPNLLSVLVLVVLWLPLIPSLNRSRPSKRGAKTTGT